jgi:hypothetical protein
LELDDWVNVAVSSPARVLPAIAIRDSSRADTLIHHPRT